MHARPDARSPLAMHVDEHNKKDGAEKTRKRIKCEDLNSEIDRDSVARRLAAHGEKFMELFGDNDASRPPRRSPSSSDATLPSGPGSELATRSGADTSDTDVEAQEDNGAQAMEFIFNSRAVVRPEPEYASTARRKPDGVALAAAEKQERRRFMSHKAAVVSAPKPTAGSAGTRRRRAPAADGGDGQAAGPGDFKALQREVQTYGASALDKKARKQFDSAALQELGAKREKGPRIPASIGLGMAKKQAQREATSLQEGIAAGMVKVKGMGKKKRREKQATLGWGLGEDAGAFRGGVLRVKGTPKTATGRAVKPRRMAGGEMRRSLRLTSRKAAGREEGKHAGEADPEPRITRGLSSPFPGAAVRPAEDIAPPDADVAGPSPASPVAAVPQRFATVDDAPLHLAFGENTENAPPPPPPRAVRVSAGDTETPAPAQDDPDAGAGASPSTWYTPIKSNNTPQETPRMAGGPDSAGGSRQMPLSTCLSFAAWMAEGEAGPSQPSQHSAPMAACPEGRGVDVSDLAAIYHAPTAAAAPPCPMSPAEKLLSRGEKRRRA